MQAEFSPTFRASDGGILVGIAGGDSGGIVAASGAVLPAEQGGARSHGGFRGRARGGRFTVHARRESVRRMRGSTTGRSIPILVLMQVVMQCIIEYEYR